MCRKRGDTLDPQRQHARLLGLWAGAIKAARRRGHREGARPDEAWLALAAQWTGHDYTFQFLPGALVQVVLWDPGPLVLMPAESVGRRRGDWRWPVVGIGPERPAMVLGGGNAVLGRVLAGRLGRSAWMALAQLGGTLVAGDRLMVTGADEALTVLAALAAGALGDRPRGEWREASARWRHRPRSGEPPPALVDPHGPPGPPGLDGPVGGPVDVQG